MNTIDHKFPTIDTEPYCRKIKTVIIFYEFLWIGIKNFCQFGLTKRNRRFWGFEAYLWDCNTVFRLWYMSIPIIIVIYVSFIAWNEYTLVQYHWSLKQHWTKYVGINKQYSSENKLTMPQHWNINFCNIRRWIWFKRGSSNTIFQ